MHDRINVIVFRRKGRKFFECQWRDPFTGLKKTRSTKTTFRREAERFAARLESELQRGEEAKSFRMTWDAFLEKYDREFLTPKAVKTRLKAISTFNAIAEWRKPRSVGVITASYISEFAAHIRGKVSSEYTVKGHLAELRKMLRWAESMDLIRRVPKIVMPSKLPGAKGRSITQEEFERIVEVVPKVVPGKSVRSWIHLLEGIWLSGLRLTEAAYLHWTDDSFMGIDLHGGRPMFSIRAEADKGREDRLFPMTPDFAHFLLATPEQERHGYVFNPVPEKGDIRLSAEWIGKMVSFFGEEAGVKVSPTARRGQAKFASAHDFRRSFGVRWCSRVMPERLKQLMRHKDIKTTMKFYIGRDAQAAAEDIWKAADSLATIPRLCDNFDETGQPQAIAPSQLAKYTPLDSNQQPSVP